MATLELLKRIAPWDYVMAQNALKYRPSKYTLDQIYEQHAIPYSWPYNCCTSLISDLTQYYTSRRAPYDVVENMTEFNALRHYISIFGGIQNMHSAVIQSTGMIETLKRPQIGLITDGEIYFPEYDLIHKCDDYLRAMPVFRRFKRWYAFAKRGLSKVSITPNQLAIGWQSPRSFFYGY